MSRIVEDKQHFLIQRGVTRPLIDDTFIGSGTITRLCTNVTSSALMSVYVRSITGSVTIKAYTAATGGREEELEVITFPVLTSSSTELLLKRAALCLSFLRIEVAYTDTVDIFVGIQGIAPGEASVEILAAANASASAATISTTPDLIVPISLTDRKGMILMNNSSSDILYVGFSAVQAASATGWPVKPGATLALDISGGATLYGVASAGSIDVRILEAAT